MTTKPISPSTAIGEYNSVPPTIASGESEALQVDSRGSLRVVMTAPDGTGGPVLETAGSDAVANARSGFNTYARSQVFNGTTWDREVKPNLEHRLLSSAATTNGTSVKGTPGNVHKIFGNNTVASKRYLKFYDKATGPVVGTDTPILTFVIPASLAFAFDLSNHFFAAGIAYAITGAAADADTTAIGAGDIECLNITYS